MGSDMTGQDYRVNDTPPAGGVPTMLAGRYRVVRKLGEGGMGTVWLAEDTKLDGCQVAIKMLPSILVNNRKAYAQVKREALVARKLTHPNIVTVRTFEEDGGNPFLVMDFGIAREVKETMTRVTGGLSSGTLMYMSPEQLHGGKPEPAQDIYSFAAMAYECLKGDPPFVRGQIEYQIEHDDPAPLGPQFASCGPGVMAGLAKAAEGRPPTCAAGLDTSDFPVESVSWDDCDRVIKVLNASRKDGLVFSLPTEAQWEYVARGGEKSRGCGYAGGNDLSALGWYGENSECRTHLVTEKDVGNELGLVGMSGNVWEWCLDWYGDDCYGQSPKEDPTGPASGANRATAAAAGTAARGTAAPRAAAGTGRTAAAATSVPVSFAHYPSGCFAARTSFSVDMQDRADEGAKLNGGNGGVR